MLRGQNVVFFVGVWGWGWVFVWGGLAVVDSVVVSFCLISKRIAIFSMNVMIGGEALVQKTLVLPIPGLLYVCLYTCMHSCRRWGTYLYTTFTSSGSMLLSPRQLQTSPPRMALPMFLWQWFRLTSTAYLMAKNGPTDLDWPVIVRLLSWHCQRMRRGARWPDLPAF